MRIVAVSTLRAYWESHPDAQQPLEAWIDVVRVAKWKTPADIKAQFRSASILPGRRVVFSVRGNDHRLVVSVAYVYGAVYIKFVFTHAEYDMINARRVESS